MQKQKRKFPQFAFFTVLFFLLFFVSGCGESNSASQDNTKNFSQSSTVKGWVWAVNNSKISTTIARINPNSNEIVAKMELDGMPEDIEVGQGGVWVTDSSYDQVLQLNSNSNIIKAKIPLDQPAGEIATSPGIVWVANNTTQSITKIDSASHEIKQIINLPNISTISDLCFGAGALWVASIDGTLTKIDPDTNKITASIKLSSPPENIAVGSNSIWVTLPEEKSLCRINSSNNKIVAKIKCGKGNDLVTNSNKVWVANYSEGTVTPIDPNANKCGDSVKVCTKIRNIAWGLDFLWVASNNDGTVCKVDPETLKVIAKIKLEKAFKVAVEE